MSESKPTRRDLLGASGAVATGATFSTLSASAAEQVQGANQRLSVGIVGPGGRGTGLLRTFSLDAVIIATPDHAHAQHLAQCLRAGKHVYCEKPFANTLDDANTTIDACRRSEKVISIGTQRRSDPHYLAAQELMRTRPIGDITQVTIIQNAHSPFRWRRDADVRVLQERDVDWRAFLMGKPHRPFDARQYLEFRLFRDFSSGIIDQWMTHLIDTVHMLAGGTFPRSVVAHGGTYAWRDHRQNPDTVHVALEYPQGFMASYSSTLTNAFGSGCRILGRTGTLEYEKTWRVCGDGIPNSQVRARAIEPQAGLQGTMDLIHMRNWLQSIRANRRATHCTAEHGYQHAIACIMAERALRSGRRQVYDERNRTIQEG
ncbi:MAG: Gfo/Idh/MocA family oxidoreductase [Planctomycetes bacterium]|nr:Gfo/Idh/MocA family oxidoreductase [Planctomycetota bacterium]